VVHAAHLVVKVFRPPLRHQVVLDLSGDFVSGCRNQVFATQGGNLLCELHADSPMVSLVPVLQHVLSRIVVAVLGADVGEIRLQFRRTCPADVNIDLPRPRPIQQRRELAGLVFRYTAYKKYWYLDINAGLLHRNTAWNRSHSITHNTHRPIMHVGSRPCYGVRV
jgi:hypothetical protein